METQQILKILESDSFTKPTLLGVFPIDKLPEVVFKPAALVVNLDSSNKPGSHWVCLFFYDKCCDYFDSYGKQPNQTLFQYIQKNCTQFKFNSTCVQTPIASTCGQLCIYFLIWRTRGIPMRDVIDSLDFNLSDEFVTRFVNCLFKVKTSTYDESFIWSNFM